MNQPQPAEPQRGCYEIADMAGQAYRAGETDRAKGLLILARMAYPDHADWWDRREAIIADHEAAS